MEVRFYLALKDPEILSFLQNAIKSNKMRDSRNLLEFLEYSESAQRIKIRNSTGFTIRILLIIYNTLHVNHSEARVSGLEGFDICLQSEDSCITI